LLIDQCSGKTGTECMKPPAGSTPGGTDASGSAGSEDDAKMFVTPGRNGYAVQIFRSFFGSTGRGPYGNYP
jgi:hypothetical protein